MGEREMGDNHDDDFDEIIFEDLPPYNPPFIRSTKHQRELLERLAARKGLHYPALIRKCNEVIDREDRIKDIGELSIGEADLVIKEIGEIRK